MYVKEKYSIKEQMLGYKLRLFLKTYQYKFWKVKEFEKQWKQSKYWSAKL